MPILSLTLAVALGSMLMIVACSDDDDNQPPVNQTPVDAQVDFSVVFMPKMGGETLNYDKKFDHKNNERVEFFSVMFFVSDVYAVKASGEKELICEIELINFDNASNTFNKTVSGRIPKGDYVGIELSSGVKPSLNNTDPAEFDLDHPLNTTTGMYWTWATNYIFHKFEGRVEDPVQDTFTSWFFHTGLDDLYRDNIRIDREFSVGGDATEVSVFFRVDKVLNSTYDLDLWNRGQSHTTDELEIATEVVDNTVNAFE